MKSPSYKCNNRLTILEHCWAERFCSGFSLPAGFCMKRNLWVGIWRHPFVALFIRAMFYTCYCVDISQGHCHSNVLDPVLCSLQKGKGHKVYLSESFTHQYWFALVSLLQFSAFNSCKMFCRRVGASNLKTNWQWIELPYLHFLLLNSSNTLFICKPRFELCQEGNRSRMTQYRGNHQILAHLTQR